MSRHWIAVSRLENHFSNCFLVLIIGLYLVLSECLGSLATTDLLKQYCVPNPVRVPTSFTGHLSIKFCGSPQRQQGSPFLPATLVAGNGSRNWHGKSGGTEAGEFTRDLGKGTGSEEERVRNHKGRIRERDRWQRFASPPPVEWAGPATSDSGTGPTPLSSLGDG